MYRKYSIGFFLMGVDETPCRIANQRVLAIDGIQVCVLSILQGVTRPENSASEYTIG